MALARSRYYTVPWFPYDAIAFGPFRMSSFPVFAWTINHLVVFARHSVLSIIAPQIAAEVHGPHHPCVNIQCLQAETNKYILAMAVPYAEVSVGKS